MSHTRAYPSTPTGAEDWGNLVSLWDKERLYDAKKRGPVRKHKAIWVFVLLPMILRRKGPFASSMCKNNAALFRTVHPQSSADRCGLRPRLARSKEVSEIFHSGWCLRERLTMRNTTGEIQSITSVVQNAVIMPMAFYIRVHFVQSC